MKFPKDALAAALGLAAGIILLPLSLLIIAAGLVFAFVMGGCESVRNTFWPDAMG